MFEGSDQFLEHNLNVSHFSGLATDVGYDGATRRAERQADHHRQEDYQRDEQAVGSGLALSGSVTY